MEDYLLLLDGVSFLLLVDGIGLLILAELPPFDDVVYDTSPTKVSIRERAAVLP